MCRKKIVVYGLGEFFKRHENIICEKYDVIAVTDKQNCYATEYDLFIMPDEIVTMDYDYIYIASEKYYIDIYLNLLKMNIPISRIWGNEVGRQMCFSYLSIYYRHCQKKTIVVIGDSHVNFFSGNETINFQSIGELNICPTVNGMPVTCFHIGPCLAYSANKEDSKTQFRNKVIWLCENFLQQNDTLLFSLGEIDLRYHILKQAEIQQRAVTEIMYEVIKEYMQFLLEMKDKYKVYVWGPIATQTDDSKMNPLAPRYGDEQQRNRLTLQFNQELQRICNKHEVGYISICEDLITKEFRTKTKYISSDYCHLSQKAMELLRRKKEWKMLIGDQY